MQQPNRTKEYATAIAIVLVVGLVSLAILAAANWTGPSTPAKAPKPDDHGACME